MDRFASPLPFADDYQFCATGDLTGEQPLTWARLWAPSNEHRFPLTRLWFLLLGRAASWDFRVMHQVNLALVAFGALMLVLATRAVRGRSHLADAFLPLIVLTPLQYETLLLYTCAYNMALAVLCLAVSAAMSGWALRSVPRLLLYVLAVLAVTWSGGPAGNLWAIGLCGVLVRGWIENRSRAWRACALIGGAAVIASSALMIVYRPPSPPGLQPYLSDSWHTTVHAAAHYAVAWMGTTLAFVWPWALAMVAVPLLYLLVRFLADLYRAWRSSEGRRLLWLDMAAVLLAVLAVAVVLGHGRGRFPDKISSRYCVLTLPIAVVLYLTLVRCAAPKYLLGLLAVCMAVCVGWNWQDAIGRAVARRPRDTALVQALRGGHEPLCLLARDNSDLTAWHPGWDFVIVDWWRKLRESGITAFRKVHGKPDDPAHTCLFWQPESGKLAGALHAEDESRAYRYRTVRAEADGPAASAAYEVVIPVSGVYRFCCRCAAAQAGQSLTVVVDEDPPLHQPVPVSPGYTACLLDAMLPLPAGPHRFAVTWPGAGSRIDVLELTPMPVPPR